MGLEEGDGAEEGQWATQAMDLRSRVWSLDGETAGRMPMELGDARGGDLIFFVSGARDLARL